MRLKYNRQMISPQQQLWELLTEAQQRVVRVAFKRIKKRDQKDLCYGLIAKLRFGVDRKYADPVMQFIFETIIESMKMIK